MVTIECRSERTCRLVSTLVGAADLDRIVENARDDRLAFDQRRRWAFIAVTLRCRSARYRTSGRKDSG